VAEVVEREWQALMREAEAEEGLRAEKRYVAVGDSVSPRLTLLKTRR
jgi:hypothetical protein